MVGSCKNNNEHSESIKVGEYFNQLSDYQLLKKDPVSYNHIIHPSTLSLF
jgi:hypothetical protein